MNHVHVLIIGIALSGGNTCSHLLERGALICQKAQTIQPEYSIAFVTENSCFKYNISLIKIVPLFILQRKMK